VAAGVAASWEEIELIWVQTIAAPCHLMLGGWQTVAGTGYYDDVTLIEDYAIIERSATSHGGSDAVKVVGGGEIKQEVVTDPEDYHQFTFWSKGDGSNGVAYQIYDVTNSAEIESGYGTTSTTYTKTAVNYYVPAGCVLLRVTFTGNDDAVVYVDDASILEYGPDTWIENKDVLAVPAITWGYGLKTGDPLQGVAGTGTADFTFENKEGLYSPENSGRISGFEEGMDIKINVEAPGVDPNWDQVFDEELTDFDAVSPAWDGEADEVADFDATVDVDGDMNDAPGEGHDGGNAIEFTLDDNNLMYGTMNAGAVNQTSGVVSFWLNLNDMSIPANEYFWIMYANDGVGGVNWQSILYNGGGDGITANCRYILDGGATSQSAYGTVIGAGDHKFTYMWEASSGAGNDDGWMSLYVDDVYYTGSTGLDNDTKDWDSIGLGMVPGALTGGSESGSFLIDTIKVDPVGAPMVDTLAAQSGTYGLSIPLVGLTFRYGAFTDPTAEKNITAECDINTNLIVGSGTFLTFMNDNSSFFTWLVYSGGEYKIYLDCRPDVGSPITTSLYTITDDWHTIRVVLSYSTGAGADDGSAKLYIDDALMETISGIDNDTKSVNNLYFGALYIPNNTYGIFYMDNCRWSNEIGLRKFIGTIQTINPTSGYFDNPVTKVTAHDWIGYLNKQELGVQAIQSDIGVETALTTCLAEFPNQPEDTDFDVGVESFEIVFAGDSVTSSMASMFSKLARNERGRIYCKGDGTLVFEKQGTRDGSGTPAFTLDGTMNNIDVSTM